MLLRKQFNGFVKVARFSTTAKPAAPTKAGEFYQNMIYRGRDGRLLPIRDLKALFALCTEPEHLKYALLGVEAFQKKGQDFSEEISGLFVNTCIKLNDPMVAVDLFLKVNRRIAAWQTASSVQRLVESTAQREAVPVAERTTKLVNMLGMLNYKGVHLLPASVETVAALAHAKNDPVLNKRMALVIERALVTAGAPEGQALLDRFPLLLSNQAQKTQGLIDSGDAEAEEDAEEEEGEEEAK